MELTVFMFFYAGKAGRIIRNAYIAFTRRKDLIFAAKDLVEVMWQPTGGSILRRLYPTNVVDGFCSRSAVQRQEIPSAYFSR
jgi:hypothetical protein